VAACTALLAAEAARPEHAGPPDHPSSSKRQGLLLPAEHLTGRTVTGQGSVVVRVNFNILVLVALERPGGGRTSTVNRPTL
jgi:hypothetical protein